MESSRLTRSTFQRQPSAAAANEAAGDIEILAKEVLLTLANDNLPPTPSKYALYFDLMGYGFFIFQPILTYLLMYPEVQEGINPKGPIIPEKLRLYVGRKR